MTASNGDPRTKRFTALNKKQKQRRGLARSAEMNDERNALIDQVFPDWRDSFSKLDFPVEPLISACVRHAIEEDKPNTRGGPVHKPSPEDEPKVIALLQEWGFLAA